MTSEGGFRRGSSMNELAISRAGHEYALAWLARLGWRLSMGGRQVEVLADGRARLAIDYPSLGELLTLVQEIDAWVAMFEEDAHSGEHHRLARSGELWS